MEAPDEGTTIAAAGVLGGPQAGGEEDLLVKLTCHKAQAYLLRTDAELPLPPPNVIWL